MQSQCAIKPNRNTLLTNYLQLLFPMSDQTVLATLSMVAFSVVVIHGRDCNHAQQIQGKVETGPTAPYRILGSQYPPGVRQCISTPSFLVWSGLQQPKCSHGSCYADGEGFWPRTGCVITFSEKYNNTFIKTLLVAKPHGIEMKDIEYLQWAKERQKEIKNSWTFVQQVSKFSC